MDLKQITQRLNEEFNKEGRRLVFWYDSEAEFADDIDSIVLEKAKLYKLEKDNTFYTKYLLERKEIDTNYLIYAPFPKPEPNENHLIDTISYSKEFHADRASLICVDYGISEEYKPIIQEYIKFFRAKDRENRFRKLEIEHYDKKSIELGIMSAVCKVNAAKFDEVIRAVIVFGTGADNEYMSEIEKYGLEEAFWEECNINYGYYDEDHSLLKLVYTFFVTFLKNSVSCDIPEQWKCFISSKVTNIVVLMSNIKNSMIYGTAYNELSSKIADDLSVKDLMKEMPLSDIIGCDVFDNIDRQIIAFLTEQLIHKNTNAEIGGLSIEAICEKRRKLHFGDQYETEYKMLYNASKVMDSIDYKPENSILEELKNYADNGNYFDKVYRKFYENYDLLKDRYPYEDLKTLIENIYTNEFLNKVTIKWSELIANADDMDTLPLQRNFYNKYVAGNKERLFVIISDALRYEIGVGLWHKLSEDEKCQAEIEPALAIVPTYTQLGMAALLPHQSLEITENYKDVLVNGKQCKNTAERESVLKAANPRAICLTYEEIKKANRSDLRKRIEGTNLIYVYHNQVDARGDNKDTEDEVFEACEQAVSEIYDLIRRLTEDVSATKFKVTADHGFIYKREKIKESEKISELSDKVNWKRKRFIITDKDVKAVGIKILSLGKSLKNGDKRKIMVPSGIDIFKSPGGGQNYVHGGISPQEMIIPVISVETKKGHTETRAASITLVSMLQKITSLFESFDFIQSEPVGKEVKSTKYKLMFKDNNGNIISNTHTHIADNKEKDSAKRIFTLKFEFAQKEYDSNKKYYLMAYEDGKEFGEPILKKEVVMDLAFSRDFGF